MIPAAHRRDLAELARALDRVIEAAAHRTRDRAVGTIRKRLTRDLRAAFRAQESAVLGALAGAQNRLQRVLAPASESGRQLREADAPDWLDALLGDVLDDTAAPFVDAIERAVGASLNAGAGETARQAGIVGSFTLDNPRAVGYAEDYAARLVAQINATTRDGIRRLVAEAFGDGWSYQQLAGAIRETYQGFHAPRPQQHIRDRAEMVAVTEVGNAYEAGARGGVDQLVAAGLTMEKSWSTIGDDRVSEECMANEAAGWIPVDDPFPSGALRPLQHPGCRCTALYRRKPQG